MFKKTNKQLHINQYKYRVDCLIDIYGYSNTRLLIDIDMYMSLMLPDLRISISINKL